MKGIKVSRTARVLMVLLVLTGLAYLGAETVCTRLDAWLMERAARPGPEPRGRVTGHAPAGEAAARITAAGDFQVIAKRNIFGAVQDAAEVKQREAAARAAQRKKAPAPVKKPKTKPKFSLVGTVAGGDANAMRAIVLNEAKKTQEMYQVGDYIEAMDAFVTAIERGKVTLEINGRTEVLEIKEPESRPGAPAAVGQPAPQPWNDVPPPAASQARAPARRRTPPQARPPRPGERRRPLVQPHSRAGFRARRPAPAAVPEEERMLMEEEGMEPLAEEEYLEEEMPPEE